MLETDLYLPVKTYLEQHGYQVNAEVKNCDIVASKEKDIIVVELKTSINLTLLAQAVSRQSISDSVYIAVPAPRSKNKQWRNILRVVKRLELGLLLVEEGAMGLVTHKQFDPLPVQRRKNSRKRKAVIKEIAERSGDYNTGGSTRKKLMTAYRETSILIACCLGRLGPSSPKTLRTLGTGEKTTGILGKNHYGWFQRLERGLYQVTEAGLLEASSHQEVFDQATQHIKVKLTQK